MRPGSQIRQNFVGELPARVRWIDPRPTIFKKHSSGGYANYEQCQQ
jgi:hypothetical protein